MRSAMSASDSWLPTQTLLAVVDARTLVAFRNLALSTQDSTPSIMTTAARAINAIMYANKNSLKISVESVNLTSMILKFTCYNS